MKTISNVELKEWEYQMCKIQKNTQNLILNPVF